MLLPRTALAFAVLLGAGCDRNPAPSDVAAPEHAPPGSSAQGLSPAQRYGLPTNTAAPPLDQPTGRGSPPPQAVPPPATRGSDQADDAGMTRSGEDGNASAGRVRASGGGVQQQPESTPAPPASPAPQPAPAPHQIIIVPGPTAAPDEQQGPPPQRGWASPPGRGGFGTHGVGGRPSEGTPGGTGEPPRR